MSELRFSKYQGLGNDFVLVDGRAFVLADPAATSRLLCDRHIGIGADGLILVQPDPLHPARMEFYNPDGSRAEMCGNGIRCVARFRRAPGLVSADSFTIATDAGDRKVGFSGEDVTVELGRPSFEPRALPALLGREAMARAELRVEGFADLPPAFCLSIGNPHCVFCVGDVASFPVGDAGPRVERLPVFPARVNVEFVERRAADRLRVRVWERGAGETRACGTGAAAAVVAATVLGIVAGRATVELPGGELEVAWLEGGGVSIAGRAEEVFRGTIDLPPTQAARRRPAVRESPRVASAAAR